MFEEFDARSQTKVLRDADHVTRTLSHARYVATDARTPQLAAREYLARYRELLGLQEDELKHLFTPTEQEPTADEVEYRLLSEKHQFDLTTVAFYQTHFGLPVWEAGLSITMKENPLRFVGAQTTRHPDPKIKRPSAQAVARSRAIDLPTLAKSLGLDSDPAQDTSFGIDHQRLMVYRYERARRTRSPGQEPNDAPALQASDPTLPLPAVDRSIREGEHYVVSAVYFRLDVRPFRPLHWVALIEVETLSVLLLSPFVDSVTGMVFQCDPITVAGAPPPNAPSPLLNPVRSTVTLPGLVPPVNGTQALSGDNVVLAEIETPPVAAPQLNVGVNFDFDARTNDFAAVNAYYNCDRFYRQLEDLGFDHVAYLPGTIFPSPVDHRGHVDPNHPQGDEINAHCVGTAGGTGIEYTSFALADLGDLLNPIGLACDCRVAMHELFGHGVLFNHVGSRNLGFSHSAGDSFAAILNDPGSRAPDRYQTFPWMFAVAPRRHNRAVAAGFGWSGNIALHKFDNVLDKGGYNNEQILSTTMFRIYQSIGGDSADIAMQRFAARVTCYLMLTAIGTLNPATNPQDAEHFADALMVADAADWASEGLSGGAYKKVIRWAFERQGLYQSSGAATPNNLEGDPPAVDVYIEDGRHGEYQFQPNHWSCQAIWNRRHNDGGAVHEEPVVGVTNYAYVNIKNRGTQLATNVTVRAFHCRPSAGLVYPDDWQPMTTAQLPAPLDVQPNSAAEVLVGPFDWVPSQVGHECMFMVVSAPNDLSNIDNFTASDSMEEWRLVPNDNNIGQRNVAPVASATMARLRAGLERERFHIKNPFRKRARMTLSAVLPAFLAGRDWRIAFTNPGADAFTLEPGGDREVMMRMLPGKDFTADDIDEAEDPVIRVEARADGILVGGMSYPLVADRRKAEKSTRRSKSAAKSRKPAKNRKR
jgi:zinc metalloprotease ZmpB